MAPIMKDWRIVLIQAHPTLFHPPADAPERAQGYPTCEGGWHGLLERLCVRIEAALAEGETIQVVQIKEKFAGLRFYWQGEVSPVTRARIHEAIALAEARSECTCELCGEEGRPYLHHGVYMTRCATHAKGRLLPAEPDQENVHVVRQATPDGFPIAPRRYDRATDSFIEVPRGSPETEE
jgi:hypothetical protein